MTWILYSFCAPLLWAISTHIDKYLVERFFKRSSVAILLVFTGLIGLVPLPIIWAYVPQVFQLPLVSIAVIAASGLLYMGALLVYLAALQGEEASFVAPLFQTSPLFGYGLAYLILGETLTGIQLVGGVLIVGSALVLTVRPGGGGLSRTKLRSILLMAGCAFSLALTSVIFKIFAVRDEFWTTTFWMFAGEALFGCGILAIPHHRHQFVGLFRVNPYAVVAINGANELINLGGGIAMRYALILGPLSLVQAITSTAPLFVFAIGVALTVAAPSLGREDLSAAELLRKGVAAALVIAGVILIAH